VRRPCEKLDADRTAVADRTVVAHRRDRLARRADDKSARFARGP
jgi:hypothetical protein